MVFENKTLMNKATCRDFLALNWPKNGGRVRVVIYLISVISVFFGFAFLQSKTDYNILTIVMLFSMAGISFSLASWGYILRLNQYIQSQYKIWGAESLAKTISFYEDVFIQESELGKLEFTYNQITDIIGNKNSLIIRMGPSALLLSKKGFTKGSEQEFIQFILDKIKENKSK